MAYIILDRDGVINFDSDTYIKSPEEWKAIPGSLDAIAQLNRCGFQVIIATNQSGIRRGYYDLDTLSAIHEKLITELSQVGGCIEEIFYCPHLPEDGCHCRKPRPGMLYQIQEKYQIALHETYFVGDSFSDVRAAKSSGCKPLLVLTGNGKKAVETYPELNTVPKFADLSAAVSYVITNEKKI